MAASCQHDLRALQVWPGWDQSNNPVSPIRPGSFASTGATMNSWERIPQGVSINITFGETAALYMAADGEGRYLKPRLLELIGDKRLSEIDQSLIDEVARALLPRGTPGTRNRQVHTPVSAVLKFGAARGLCNYFRIARPRRAKIAVRLPASDELDRFLKAAGPSLKRIAIFLLHTHVTVEAALRLEWHQLDLARRRLRLRFGRRKRERVISLDPRVTEMLARFLHREGKVFRRPDGSPYQTVTNRGGQLKTAFRGACSRAGVPSITPRTLQRVRAGRHFGHRNAA
jgi:integrase